MVTQFFIWYLILMSFFTVLAYGYRYQFLFWLLLASLLFRLSLVYMDYHDVFTIPGSDADARNFIIFAWALSSASWEEIFASFQMATSRNYSYFGAIVFKVFGYHQLIMPLMNILAGVFVVAITGVITYRLWGAKSSQIAVFIIAFYPFSAFNSAVALREEFSILAFLIGLYYLIRWGREESILGVYVCLLFFSIATIIHPGWIAAIVGVGAYALYLLLLTLYGALKGQLVSSAFCIKFMQSFTVVLLSVALSASGGVSLGKGISVGSEDGAGVTEMIEAQFEGEARGGSAYPSFIATGNPFTQPWLIPARIVYFIFSPFPWDISSARHAMGLVATIAYAFLAWRIYKGWEDIRHKPECLVLLFILAALIIVFALGVTNVGTAIRHKTKFIALFIILAASSFDSISLRRVV